MAYQGDIAYGQVLNFKYTTRDATGTPSTLSGGNLLVIYRDNSTSDFSQGLSLTTDFDSVVGLNNVQVATASGSTVFLEGHDYQVVHRAGQISNITIAGEVVGEFSVSNRFGGALVYGLLSGVASTSNISLPSTASATSDIYNGALVVMQTGPGQHQARFISDYTGAGLFAQLDSALAVAVTSATTAVVYPGAPAVSASINSIAAGSYSGVTISGLLSAVSADVHQLVGSAPAMTRLLSHVSSILSGRAVAGTLSTTEMTTDISLTTSGTLNGRIIVFVGGGLNQESTSINTVGGHLGFSNSSARLYFQNITGAPASGQSFLVI